MALATKITSAARFRRLRQSRAEARLDEQILVAESRDQVDEFTAHDAVSDVTFETAIRRLYRALDTQEQKNLCATVFAVWKQAEAQDDVILADHASHIDRTRVVMFQNNPLFIEQDVPDGSNGAA